MPMPTPMPPRLTEQHWWLFVLPFLKAVFWQWHNLIFGVIFGAFEIVNFFARKREINLGWKARMALAGIAVFIACFLAWKAWLGTTISKDTRTKPSPLVTSQIQPTLTSSHPSSGSSFTQRAPKARSY